MMVNCPTHGPICPSGCRWSDAEDLKLANQEVDRLLTLVEVLQARVARLEEVAGNVMHYTTPPDLRSNCYFCNDMPHVPGCAWMELSDALAGGHAMTFYAVDPGPLPPSYGEMEQAILAFAAWFGPVGESVATPADIVLLSLAERISACAPRTPNAAILGDCGEK